MTSTAQPATRAESRPVAPRYLFAQVFARILSVVALVMAVLFLASLVEWLEVAEHDGAAGDSMAYAQGVRADAAAATRLSLFAMAMLVATGAGLSMLRDIAISAWHARNRGIGAAA